MVIASPAARAHAGGRGFPPMSDPPAVALVAAVRAFALATAGLPPRRLVVTLADHSRLAIDIPDGPPAAAAWPPRSGWAVRWPDFSLDGRVFRVTGKPGEVLRALAAGPVPHAELKRRVWDEHTDDRTVQNAVSKLRQVLRDELGLPADADPILVTDAGYLLSAG